MANHTNLEYIILWNIILLFIIFLNCSININYNLYFILWTMMGTLYLLEIINKNRYLLYYG